MNSQEFAYWLQGFFELNGSNKLNEKQVQIIKDHLALVMTKVTPERSKPICTTVRKGSKNEMVFC